MHASRPLRADAARKREQIVRAATAELADLAAQPAEDTTQRRRLSLDAIAARAEVGIGTLYRHFPTREALLETVYRHELDELCQAATTMAADADGQPVDEALLTWMLRYVDFVDAKRALGEDLRALIASGSITQTTTREKLGTAITHFLDAGATTGVWRDDIMADDVVAAMAGAVVGAAGDQRIEQTKRLLRLLIDGLRRLSPTGWSAGQRADRR